EATERNQTEGCLLLDNVQQYCDVYEQGIGRQSQLKVGTAGTRLKLEDCAPGAFDADVYYEKVALQQRKTLTTDSLFDDIDWTHMRVVIPLHWVRALVEFAVECGPEITHEFQHLVKEIADMFREPPVARHRMRDSRKLKAQPLSTNSERSTEAQGMERAVGDFDQQVGINSDEPGNLLSWIRGDGASYAALWRLTKYCAPLNKFKNKISTPEIWHTGSTDLNSTSANHYGPATSSDPSSLSRSSNIAGLKRPSNIKSCDYYPTVRNLNLIWKAHVRDCWRIFFEADDLEDHLRNLVISKDVPDLSTLLGSAMVLVDRYATQSAIQRCLSASDSTDPELPNISDIPDLTDIVDSEAPVDPPVQPKVPEDAPTVHQEKPGFTGDRVLRNSEIFLQDFGWWIEFAHAVPEGDIGRVWEIMKIWIFKFAGSSHQNYMGYLLEVYCMLRYEASKDLINAIFNNWLLNVKGELGKWLPADLHQEHYNKWLEDMIQRHGGELHNQFYRQTISPNVHHFLQIKEEVETAFSLEHRGKTHTSPHLRSELKLLLATFKEEEVHLFRSGRSLGHAAANQFARGWRRLDDNKLDDFLTKSTVLGDFLQAIRKTDGDSEMRSESSTPSIPASDSADSASSVETSSSMRSLADIDPNEPSGGKVRFRNWFEPEPDRTERGVQVQGSANS
ncbi:hypothetical protein DFH09DRAFT_900277, partial [Mycena vulgaris]